MKFVFWAAVALVALAVIPPIGVGGVMFLVYLKLCDIQRAVEDSRRGNDDDDDDDWREREMALADMAAAKEITR